MLVLDSGGLSRLAERSPQAVALITALRRAGLWPPVVPSIVLVESLSGHPGRDAGTNRFLTTCAVDARLDTARARQAARLRGEARRGSAADAVVVASAEPGGTILTSDPKDLTALAAHADGVAIVRV